MTDTTLKKIEELFPLLSIDKIQELSTDKVYIFHIKRSEDVECHDAWMQMLQNLHIALARKNINAIILPKDNLEEVDIYELERELTTKV